MREVVTGDAMLPSDAISVKQRATGGDGDLDGAVTFLANEANTIWRSYAGK
ncbi:MAG TPA: hypothetical protein VOA64_04120 [Candidatus Dormibacteraeota bacterium]|nr:hypothetical protein [Candidatus Dormibacteraeota bacterium]